MNFKILYWIKEVSHKRLHNVMIPFTLHVPASVYFSSVQTVPGCFIEENLAKGLGWKQQTAIMITTITECLRAWHYPEIWVLLLFYGWENWASDRAYDLPKATQEINTGARFISSSRISSFQSSSFTLRVKKRIWVMQERNQPRIASWGWRREGGREKGRKSRRGEY